ncbi:SH3 domain-containing protein [Nocardioides pyridinolyticus]
MAEHRHKRDADARRMPRAAFVAGPLAVLATASAVALGVAAAEPETPSLFAQESAADLGTTANRDEAVSRSTPRLAGAALQQQLVQRAEQRAEKAATARAVARADTRLWTTTVLNLWSDETRQAEKVGEIDSGERVLVTGREAADRVEIVLDGRARWVTAGYLSDEKPVAGIGGDCTNGTSVSSGVSPNVVKVHQAVCAAFPEITTYGTFRGDGEHAQGIAVDIMVSGERGWEVAEFIRENYAELGVSYLIYSQQIWSVEQAGAGWRGMSDRGSATANHYDHVHVTTY